MRSLLAFLALGLLFTAPADAAKRGKCARPDSETVAKNRQVRVFERSGRTSAGYGTRLVGCLRANGRTVRLDEAYDDNYVQGYGYDHVRLAEIGRAHV